MPVKDLLIQTLPPGYKFAPFRLLITFSDEWKIFEVTVRTRTIEALYQALWEAVKEVGKIVVWEVKRVIVKTQPGFRAPIYYTGALYRSIGYWAGPGYYRFKEGVYRREPWLIIACRKKVPAPPPEIGSPVEEYAAGIEFGRAPYGWPLPPLKEKQLKKWLETKFPGLPAAIKQGILRGIGEVGTVANPFLSKGAEAAKKYVYPIAEAIYNKQVKDYWETQLVRP